MERFILSTKADNGFELNAWLEPDPHGPYVLFSSADAQTALLEAYRKYAKILDSYDNETCTWEEHNEKVQLEQWLRDKGEQI